MPTTKDQLKEDEAQQHLDNEKYSREASVDEKKQYKDNVIVTGETFNHTKFTHKLYFQNGATKEEVENAVRAREVSAQRASLKIEQGQTNEEAVAQQKKVDEAAKKGPKVVASPPPSSTVGKTPPQK